jgi:hypothetical protein
MDTRFQNPVYTLLTPVSVPQPEARTRLQESEPVRASREAEFIPAYPDDNDLSRQQQRQQALNSDESTRPFAEVSQMTGEEQSRGRFLDLYA